MGEDREIQVDCEEMDGKTYQVSDIFASLHGEGYWAGCPVVFVRFSGCNLNCELCDTDHDDYEEMDAADLIKRVSDVAHDYFHTVSARMNIRIIFTGGEPMLQLDYQLLQYFRSAFNPVNLLFSIETNGTITPYSHVADQFSWIAINPKIVHEDPRQQFNQLIWMFGFRGRGEIRIALSTSNVHQWEPLIKYIDSVSPDRSFAERTFYYLSPVFEPTDNPELYNFQDNLGVCIDMVRKYSAWQLSMQQHKLLGFR